MNELERQKERYREADAKRQQEIEALRNSDQLLDMTDEIAGLKVLIREARLLGQTSVVERLTSTLAKLVKDERNVRISNHELVSKACMRRWAKQVEELLEDTFRDQFEGWQLSLRCFRNDMRQLLKEAASEDKELKGLI